MANLKKCPNGHFYDADHFSQCPYCPQGAAAASETPSVQPMRPDISVTQPIRETGPAAPQPDPSVTQPVAVPPVQGPAEIPRKKKPSIAFIAVSVAAVVFAIFTVVFYGQMIDWRNSCSFERSESDRYQRELYNAQAELETAQDELQALNTQLESVQNELRSQQEKLDRYSDLEGLYDGYGSDRFYAKQGVVVLKRSDGAKKLTVWGNLGGTYRFNKSSSGISCSWGDWYDGHYIDLTITPNSTGFYTITFTHSDSDVTFDVLVIVN